MPKLRSRLTYANVMSAIAVFVAVGGGAAYAANTVFSTDIVDGEVATRDLANGAVTIGKLAGNSVNSARVANGSLTGADVDESTLSGVQPRVRWVFALLDGSVAQSRGVDSVTKTGTGAYRVDFDGSVANCAILASLSSGSGWGWAKAGLGGVGDPSDIVLVDTHEPDGTPMDSHFYTAVLC